MKKSKVVVLSRTLICEDKGEYFNDLILVWKGIRMSLNEGNPEIVSMRMLPENIILLVVQISSGWGITWNYGYKIPRHYQRCFAAREYRHEHIVPINFIYDYTLRISPNCKVKDNGIFWINFCIRATITKEEDKRLNKEDIPTNNSLGKN